MKKAVLIPLIVFIVILLLGMYVMGGFYQQTEASKLWTVSVGGFVSLVIFINLEDS